MEKKNILIIGASGQISQELIDLLLDKTEHHLTLYLRNKAKLMNIEDGNRVTLMKQIQQMKLPWKMHWIKLMLYSLV